MRSSSVLRYAALTSGILALAGLSVVALWPTATDTLVSHPDPTQSYDQAIARYAQFQSQEASIVAPYGRSRLLTHDRRTERAIVFIHGITNGPEQYVKLGAMFHKHGYNVLVPRMPHHGLIDRSTQDLRLLTAEQLCAYADTAIDIAHGLGHHVTVAGISAGGVICAWLAQERVDVDQAVLIASAFRTNEVPSILNNVAMNLFTRLPDLQLAITSGLPHAYTAHSTRGFGEVMRLGEAVRRKSQIIPPAARSAVIVNNANDSVDNALTNDLVERWRRNGMQNITIYEFAKDLGFIHDIIDPAQKEQHTDYVYPILFDLINQNS